MNDSPDRQYSERSNSGPIMLVALLMMAFVAIGLFVYVQNSQKKDIAISATTSAQQFGESTSKQPAL